MSTFPDSIDTFRDVENLPGLTYDANDKKTLFAEDIQALASAVVATQEFVVNLANVMNDHFDHQDYKVGDIFLSFSSTNPSIQFGYGTWSLVSQGRTLLGVDTGDTDFNTVKKTGGAKTHTLTITEMPNHNHNQGVNDNAIPARAWGGSGVDRFRLTDSGNQGSSYPIGAMISKGGGGAHNNLQPYLTCYIWERTA